MVHQIFFLVPHSLLKTSSIISITFSLYHQLYLSTLQTNSSLSSIIHNSKPLIFILNSNKFSYRVNTTSSSILTSSSSSISLPIGFKQLSIHSKQSITISLKFILIIKSLNFKINNCILLSFRFFQISLYLYKFFSFFQTYSYKPFLYITISSLIYETSYQFSLMAFNFNLIFQIEKWFCFLLVSTIKQISSV